MTNKYWPVCKTLCKIIAIGSFLINISCSDRELSMGENLLESQTHVTLIDTFTVKVSTLLLDSIPTSGDSLILLGNYTDAKLGKINASSYFQIGVPDAYSVYNDDVFDSIKLFLRYTGYSYGDTLKDYAFSIHELTAQPETDDKLYNTSNVPWSDVSLAYAKFKPRPGRKDSLEISLPYQLGLELFTMLQENSDTITSETTFLNYFNGLALISDTTVTNCILGFIAKPGHLKIRLYYHRFAETYQNLSSDFPLTNNDVQFNRISHDFSGTKLTSLTNQRILLSSDKTDNEAYMLGCVGLTPKFQIPYLQELLNYKHGEILKAELVFKPTSDSYSKFPLPRYLTLYKSDKYNRFISDIKNSNDQIITASLTEDDMYNEATSYTMEMSPFIISDFNNGYFDPESGWLLTQTSSAYNKSFTHLILSCKNPAPQLKIYFATY